MKGTTLVMLALSAGITTRAQHMPVADTTKTKSVLPVKQTIKPYKDVITDKAVTQRGLFTVHKVEEKYYFEISDSLLGREILSVIRFSKLPGGAGAYGGELANQQTLRFEKGPDNTLFLRAVILMNTADSTQTISQAVTNSNLDPILAAFPVVAIGKDSTSRVIDVTDYFKGDNQAVGLPPRAKKSLSLAGLAPERSYIQSIHSFPLNTEIRTVKTYNSIPSDFGGSPAASSGAITLEMNASLLLLPERPMSRRLYDKRVGYFSDAFTVYSDDQQEVDKQSFIVRWRMEPKPEDREKYRRGELVEPAKPILFYIDPATPKKWRPYLIAGINDWQKAFEKAGFKNAISAKEWPENDTTMSLEDARFSVLRYFASDIANAYGPQIHDPRSGEILESHIGWYHNVMKLVHDWYMVQTAAVDPKARRMKFDDALMGQLIRFVSSHEVGHTLGLRHNMGASSATPVEKLRDKKWLDLHGHTASIMDYARFNYVAQPEDSIPETDLFPRINDYDEWAIQWGYRFTGITDAEADKKTDNHWIIDSLASNPRLWFGGEGNGYDPRSQSEDLGDNAMKASAYGIKNLQRILPHLPEWTREEGDPYENLERMYNEVIGQYRRYIGHVLENIGGVQETFKSVEEPGDVYTPTPRLKQKEAISFLNSQLFKTPYWLTDTAILNKTTLPSSAGFIGRMQTGALQALLSAGLWNELMANEGVYGSSRTYPVAEMISDLKKNIWEELAVQKPIDVYKRGLQKTWIESLISLVKPPDPVAPMAGMMGSRNAGGAGTTDVPSIAKEQLKILQREIQAALAGVPDKSSRIHLQDCLDRIDRALHVNK